MGLALQVFGVAWGFGVSDGASGFGSVSPTSSGITTYSGCRQPSLHAKRKVFQVWGFWSRLHGSSAPPTLRTSRPVLRAKAPPLTKS